MMRVSRHKRTKRIIEAESGVSEGVMTDKAVAAGYLRGEVEEIEMADNALIAALREQNLADGPVEDRQRNDILKELPVHVQLKALWGFVATIAPDHPICKKLEEIKRRHIN